MIPKREINDIMSELHQLGIIDSTARVNNQMNGSTEGVVYTISIQEEPRYVLKFDQPEDIVHVEQLHLAYVDSPLLAKLLYTDPEKSYMVYSYIAGTTHYNRGSKVDWLSRFVKDFLNHYKRYEGAASDRWGRLSETRETWREFNERSVESTRIQLGDLLSSEDHLKVASLVESISTNHEPYYLHGDTGVHNFVFKEGELAGVIDPSPMIGPVIYDFTYAYCSSPDALNLETLFAAYELLDHEPKDTSRLTREVIVQLYCRIGICTRHHPQDLEQYLKAWDYWRTLA